MLIDLQRKIGFRVESRHIKGEENKGADELSRVFSDYVVTRHNKRLRTTRINPDPFLERILKFEQSLKSSISNLITSLGQKELTVRSDLFQIYKDVNKSEENRALIGRRKTTAKVAFFL